MNRLCRLVFCAAFAAGCAKDAPASPPASAATPQADTGAASLDPRFALQSVVAQPPPPDGTYLVDAIVVHVQSTGSIDVTNDLADSASWSLRVSGHLEGRFKVGARYRLTVRVEHGAPMIVDATAQ